MLLEIVNHVSVVILITCIIHKDMIIPGIMENLLPDINNDRSKHLDLVRHCVNDIGIFFRRD